MNSPVEEKALPREALYLSDEVFMVGTTAILDGKDNETISKPHTEISHNTATPDGEHNENPHPLTESK